MDVTWLCCQNTVKEVLRTLCHQVLLEQKEVLPNISWPKQKFNDLTHSSIKVNNCQDLLKEWHHIQKCSPKYYFSPFEIGIKLCGAQGRKV